jgi:hypothetical protein
MALMHAIGDYYYNLPAYDPEICAETSSKISHATVIE